MALSLACSVLGAGSCDDVITGETTEDILKGIVDHTSVNNGIDQAELETEEMQDRF